MQFQKLNNSFIVYVEKGEKVMETLTNFCIENNIHSGRGAPPGRSLRGRPGRCSSKRTFNLSLHRLLRPLLLLDAVEHAHARDAAARAAAAIAGNAAAARKRRKPARAAAFLPRMRRAAQQRAADCTTRAAAAGASIPRCATKGDGLYCEEIGAPAGGSTNASFDLSASEAQRTIA